MLSPDGSCKSFDADANGYVRSEGCGIVVLKRLEDAQRDGDTVLAVVRGSAVNQDGASSGQTVPNGPAQQALMRQALQVARLAPAEVDYVGRTVPAPVSAIRSNSTRWPRSTVTATARRRWCWARSRPTWATWNRRPVSPASSDRAERGARAHSQTVAFHRAHPHAGPGASKFVIAAEPMDWPEVNRPRRAAVSSFGVSGTNAHVLIEQAPAAEPTPANLEPPVNTLLVTGRTPERIAATAGRLADWLDGQAGTGVRLADVAHTLSHHRAGTRSSPPSRPPTSNRRWRAARLAGGYPAPGVTAPHSGPCGTGMVFVYSGQGSQWAGMGRRLLADEPAFASAVDDLEPVFVGQAGFSLRESSNQPAGRRHDRIQPVLVGVQLALTALWRAYGVTRMPSSATRWEVTAAVVAVR